MLSLGWGEIGVVVLAALLLLGPKEALPLLSNLGKWWRRARTAGTDFLSEIDALSEKNTLEKMDVALRADAESGKGAERVAQLVSELKPPPETPQ